MLAHFVMYVSGKENDCAYDWKLCKGEKDRKSVV